MVVEKPFDFLEKWRVGSGLRASARCHRRRNRPRPDLPDCAGHGLTAQRESSDGKPGRPQRMARPDLSGQCSGKPIGTAIFKAFA